MNAMQNELNTGKPADHSQYKFEDDRLNELCFRLTARNWPDTLSADDHVRWKAFCRHRVHNGQDGFRSLEQYRTLLEQLKTTGAMPENLNKLAEYGDTIADYSE